MKLQRKELVGLAGGAVLSLFAGGLTFAATSQGTVLMYLYDNCWYNPLYKTTWYSAAECEFPANVSPGGTVTAGVGADYNLGSGSGGDDYMGQISYKTSSLDLQTSSYGDYSEYSGTQPSEVIVQDVSNGRIQLTTEWNDGSKNVSPNYGYAFFKFTYSGGSSYHWDNTSYNNGADLAFDTYGVENPCFKGQYMPSEYDGFGPASNPVTIYDPPPTSTTSSMTASEVHSSTAEPTTRHQTLRALPKHPMTTVPWVFENTEGKVVGRFASSYVFQHKSAVENSVRFKF